MKDNKDNIIDELLIRYLTGMVNAQERAEAESWIGQSIENTQYFKKFKRIWESSSNLKIYQQIDTESSLKNVKKRIDFKQAKKSQIKPLWIVMRIAAVLVLFFSVYLVLRQGDGKISELKFTRLESGEELKTIMLPDSTVIALNISSFVEYSDSFNLKERRIKFEGEAYFEIKPDKSRPFIIETSRSETKVLGTAFNLKAYSNQKTESIVVTHGLVQFSKKADRIKKPVLLAKGEKAVLADSIEKELNTDPNFMSWKTGIFLFNNELLPKAIELFSEYYHVEFKIQDENIKSLTLSGKFEKKSLDEMLEILEITLQIKVDKKNGQYWLRN
jgi:ferric-dicitrate binding protein FerR (iron transport regulator)